MVHGWLDTYVVLVFTGEAALCKAAGTAVTCSSYSSREQAGNTVLAGIGSSELRLEMENISLVTNDAQMMSELSPAPTTT